MTRIEALLAKVNIVLANKGRWESSNLLSLLDTAQKLIAQRTEVLKRTTVIDLVNGQSVYQLDNNVYRIYRVLYRGQTLPIRTREYLDSVRGVEWETHKAERIECIVTNLMDIPSLRIYPTLAIVPNWPLYGVLTSWMDMPIEPPQGVCTGFEADEPWEVNSTEGVVTNITENLMTGEQLTIYHSYVPSTLQSTSDELHLSFRYDNALVHYTTAMALRQNEDTQSRSMAGEELQLFQIELQQIYKDAMQESTADATSFEVTYSGGF